MWVGGQSDLFSEKKFTERLRLISVIFAIGYAIIALRLFYLQILRGDDLAELSESNRTQVLFLRAPRGDFYDHKGRVFITNRPSWSLMYSTPIEYKDKIDLIEERLNPYLQDYPRRWRRRLNESSVTGQMVRLVEDVPKEISFAMQEMGEMIPGLRVVMEFRRSYPLGFLAGHLVGYLSEIDQEELRKDFWQLRRSGDLIGKVGLEKLMDESLRGRDGGMLIEVDSIGRLKRLIKELPSQKGSSVQLTLDVKIQDEAERALAESPTGRGAVVVMNPQSGAVLAWASAPSFDVDGSLAENLTDPDKPFFDRVHKGAYPPGSPFKMVTALAGFNKGVIRINAEIDCVGYVKLKDRRLKERKYRCWRKHGKVNYWKAVSESCDSYFYLLGQKMGPEPIHDVAVAFGMGKQTQKYLPGERMGTVPNAAWKKKKGMGGWSTGDTYNMAIGQGFLTTTPLQIAVFAAGLATKGLVYQPYVIKKVVEPGQDEPGEGPSKILSTVEASDATWAAIHEAMRLVVDGGTGRAAYVPHLKIYGKTGTAENPHGKDHAWFIAFGGYPGEKPSLAICVFIENGGGGGAVAAPIARRIFEVALPDMERLEI